MTAFDICGAKYRLRWVNGTWLAPLPGGGWFMTMALPRCAHPAEALLVGTAWIEEAEL